MNTEKRGILAMSRSAGDEVYIFRGDALLKLHIVSVKGRWVKLGFEGKEFEIKFNPPKSANGHKIT